MRFREKAEVGETCLIVYLGGRVIINGLDGQSSVMHYING